MTDSCWFPEGMRGEYVLNTLFALERLWSRYGTDTKHNVTFKILHAQVWNGGVWNGIQKTCSGSLDRVLHRDARFPLFRTNHTER